MITLAKHERAGAGLERTARATYYKNVATIAYDSSGLKAAQAAQKRVRGYITVEHTPGHINHNPARKMVKTVYYSNDPHTRYGYVAKFKITEEGLIEQ